MSLVVLFIAASAQATEPSGCMMLALLRAPSRSARLLSERIEVCAERGPRRGDSHFNFTMIRTPRGASPVTLHASSRTCPAARARLIEVERLPKPSIEVLPRERELAIIGDGTLYRLDVRRAPWGEGPHNGSIRLESNVRTPLARWADALLDALAPCWRA